MAGMDDVNITQIEAKLIRAAAAVRSKAHAPYSSFYVGAAILDNQGQIHCGANVENAAYPLGSCAEPNAIGAMIAAGGRRIRMIAITGGKSDGPMIFCPPCGGCRQRIAEFADGQTVILLQHQDGRIDRFTMDALLPYGFSADALQSPSSPS